MIDVVRNRLRLHFSPGGADSGDSLAADSAPVHDRSLPEVEFVAYADDCRLFGHLRLSGDRLTDMLNEYEEYILVDVLAESLLDGSEAETIEIVVTRDELLAVEATGPRGSGDRRLRTQQHPMALKAGPYLVQGYLHAQLGLDPLMTIRRRGPMVPLTSALIAYTSGGVRGVHEATTLLVNRERTDWIAPVGDEERAFPDVPVLLEHGSLLAEFPEIASPEWALEPG
ncbi:MAG TPA: hypothetical protein VGK63_07295 [Candidatus Limnocylindrales bacterium]